MFGLRVTSALGVYGEAYIEVFKSADALPALKVWSGDAYNCIPAAARTRQQE